jgi:hypothetical protein
VGAPPLPQPEILHLAYILVGDALGIADQQGADALSHCEVDHEFGRFVMGLVDVASVTSLEPALLGSVAPPPTRTALPRPRGAAGCLRPPGLLVAQVQVTLGSDSPAGHQQRCMLGDHRVGMDDAKVDSRNPIRVETKLLNRYGGGNREPEPATIGEQRNRSDLPGRVGNRAGESHPQLRSTLGHRQAHPSILQQKCSLVEPHRHQAALAPWKPRVLPAVAALG